MWFGIPIMNNAISHIKIFLNFWETIARKFKFRFHSLMKFSILKSRTKVFSSDFCENFLNMI